MIKSSIIAIFSPVILLISLVALDSMAVHYLSLWPLKFIEALGFITNPDEGFYNKWYGVSLISSIAIQIVVIFIVHLTYTTKKKD